MAKSGNEQFLENDARNKPFTYYSRQGWNIQIARKNDVYTITTYAPDHSIIHKEATTKQGRAWQYFCQSRKWLERHLKHQSTHRARHDKE